MFFLTFRNVTRLSNGLQTCTDLTHEKVVCITENKIFASLVQVRPMKSADEIEVILIGFFH